MTQQQEQELLFKRALLTPLFLFLNADQTYARMGQSISSRSLASDDCYYPNAKKVRMESTTGEVLSMFELQALSVGDSDAALNGAASQSSTLNTKSASLAIDGDATTFSHTATDDLDASWEVDLGSMTSLKSIQIKNRWCGDQSDPLGCLCRLSGATMSLLDDQDLVVATKTMGNTCQVHDLSFDLSSCPSTENDTTSTNEVAVPLITHTDAVIVEDDSFWITFHNPLGENTEIFGAVIANSHCTNENSSFEVDSSTPNVNSGPSSATVMQSINELITAEDRNQGSAYLSFCLRADVRANEFASSLLASKVSVGITVNFEAESDLVLDGSSGFNLQLDTLDFSDTVVNYQSDRDLNIHAALGACASPGNAGPFAIGSTLEFCVKSMDSDVVISGLSDVYFTDTDGNPILDIVDASGEASFVTTVAGLESKAVDVATMMATTIYDQGYGGTTINVRGTVSVTYIDHRRGRQLEAVEQANEQSFAVKVVVAETASLEDYSKSASETNRNKAIGAVVVTLFIAGLFVASIA